MTTDYHAIACDQHWVLELLAMRRRAVRIGFLGADGCIDELVGVAADVLTRDGAEFLLVETDTGEVALRLDRLSHIFDDEQCVYRRQKSVDER